MSPAETAPAIPSTRAAKKAETRQRVLAAAMEVFAKRGFERATTAEIAELAGVAHGTVFAVAPSKESLVAAAYANDIRTAGEQIAATLPLDVPLLDQLMHVFDGLFDYYSVNPSLSRAIVQHLLFIPDAEAKSAHDNLLTGFLEDLKSLVDAAKLTRSVPPEIDSMDLAGQCFATYLMFLLSLLNDTFPDRATHRDACRRSLRLLLRDG